MDEDVVGDGGGRLMGWGGGGGSDVGVDVNCGLLKAGDGTATSARGGSGGKKGEIRERRWGSSGEGVCVGSGGGIRGRGGGEG